MSEEESVESENQEGESEPIFQPDSPWSAPPITEVSDPVDVDLEPLKPLEPSFADLITGALGPVDQYSEEVDAPLMPSLEEERPPLLRPTVLSVEACPQGLVGICINCSEYPCSYMLNRCLRYLLAVNQYGQARGGGI